MTALLDNKVFVITGATGTIGKAASLHLAHQGATIILMGRQKKALEKLYDEIVAFNYSEPILLEMDFNQVTPEDYLGLSHNIAQEFSHLDGLLHCATHFESLTPLSLVKAEEWQKTLTLSLDAPFYLTNALIPLLKNAQPRASVIFFEHGAVDFGKPYWGSYAVAKAGLKTLKNLYAEEFEAIGSIQFNSIDPISIRSNLQMRVSPSGPQVAHELTTVMSLIDKLIDTSQPMVNGITLKTN